MFPLLLVIFGVGTWWLLNRDPDDSKQLPPGPGPIQSHPPVPLSQVSEDQLGLALTYHSAMVDPGAFDREQLGEIVGALHDAGFTYEGANLTARANGQQYPTEILEYHNVLIRWNEYEPNQIAALADWLNEQGYMVYALDLNTLLENMG